MTKTVAEIAEDVAPSLRGWRTLGDRKSDGEVMCTGCWDRSNHDTSADHDIPSGDPVFWSSPHPEYGDCDAYCTRCVIDDAECEEIIDAGHASELLQHLKGSEHG